MKFTTYSGSTYEISDGKIRRLNPDYEKRADGEWATLFNDPDIEVGSPAVLALESLAKRGPDDVGTPEWLKDNFTTRVTSIVISKDEA